MLSYVADLEAVRKAVGAKRIHLIGHSWGGLVSMRYATVHPETVKSIILMGSGPPRRDDQIESRRQITSIALTARSTDRLWSMKAVRKRVFDSLARGLPGLVDVDNK